MFTTDEHLADNPSLSAQFSRHAPFSIRVDLTKLISQKEK